MNQLVKYEAAKYALQEAVAVDEVKDIRDKAVAMATYAKQAKDTELVMWATEIRVRAERRAGQILAEMPKATGELRNSSRYSESTTTKTLAELGISKNESSRWQKLADVSDTKFENAVAAAREVAGQVTAAAILRAEHGTVATPRTKPEVAPVIDVTPDYTELDAAHDKIEDLQAELAVASMGNASADDKFQASNLIEELRSEVKTLKATLSAVKTSRDILQNENAELKKQVSMQRRELDKLTGKKK